MGKLDILSSFFIISSLVGGILATPVSESVLTSSSEGETLAFSGSEEGSNSTTESTPLNSSSSTLSGVESISTYSTTEIPKDDGNKSTSENPPLVLHPPTKHPLYKIPPSLEKQILEMIASANHYPDIFHKYWKNKGEEEGEKPSSVAEVESVPVTTTTTTTPPSTTTSQPPEIPLRTSWRMKGMMRPLPLPINQPLPKGLEKAIKSAINEIEKRNNNNKGRNEQVSTSPLVNTTINLPNNPSQRPPSSSSPSSSRWLWNWFGLGSSSSTTPTPPLTPTTTPPPLFVHQVTNEVGEKFILKPRPEGVGEEGEGSSSYYGCPFIHLPGQLDLIHGNSNIKKETKK